MDATNVAAASLQLVRPEQMTEVVQPKYRGVRQRNSRFTAEIKDLTTGQTVWLGSFLTALEAAVAYDAAAVQLRGDAAALNFPPPGYKPSKQPRRAPNPYVFRCTTSGSSNARSLPVGIKQQASPAPTSSAVAPACNHNQPVKANLQAVCSESPSKPSYIVRPEGGGTPVRRNAQAHCYPSSGPTGKRPREQPWSPRSGGASQPIAHPYNRAGGALASPKAAHARRRTWADAINTGVAPPTLSTLNSSFSMSDLMEPSLNLDLDLDELLRDAGMHVSTLDSPQPTPGAAMPQARSQSCPGASAGDSACDLPFTVPSIKTSARAPRLMAPAGGPRPRGATCPGGMGVSIQGMSPTCSVNTDDLVLGSESAGDTPTSICGGPSAVMHWLQSPMGLSARPEPSLHTAPACGAAAAKPSTGNTPHRLSSTGAADVRCGSQSTCTAVVEPVLNGSAGHGSTSCMHGSTVGKFNGTVSRQQSHSFSNGSAPTLPMPFMSTEAMNAALKGITAGAAIAASLSRSGQAGNARGHMARPPTHAASSRAPMRAGMRSGLAAPSPCGSHAGSTAQSQGHAEYSQPRVRSGPYSCLTSGEAAGSQAASGSYHCAASPGCTQPSFGHASGAPTQAWSPSCQQATTPDQSCVTGPAASPEPLSGSSHALDAIAAPACGPEDPYAAHLTSLAIVPDDAAAAEAQQLLQELCDSSWMLPSTSSLDGLLDVDGLDDLLTNIVGDMLS